MPPAEASRYSASPHPIALTGLLFEGRICRRCGRDVRLHEGSVSVELGLDCRTGLALSEPALDQLRARLANVPYAPVPPAPLRARVERVVNGAIRWPYKHLGWNDAPGYGDEPAATEADQ
jgi:hypothetical protein